MSEPTGENLSSLQKDPKAIVRRQRSLHCSQVARSRFQGRRHTRSLARRRNLRRNHWNLGSQGALRPSRHARCLRKNYRIANQILSSQTGIRKHPEQVPFPSELGTIRSVQRQGLNTPPGES